MEGEFTYTGTFNELQDAFLLTEDIHTCSKLDCALCNTYNMLLRNENVQKYFASKNFKELCRLPIDTAQCYQLQGWAAGAILLVNSGHRSEYVLALLGSFNW
jgi:hypothetical protein